MSSSQGTRLAGLALGRALNRGPILVAGSSAVLAATATPPTATFNTVGGSVVCPPCHMRTLSSKAESTDVIPTTGAPGKSGAAFPNDLRSTSGLGLGDGLSSHTDKWLDEGVSPMDLIASVPPIGVDVKIFACRGTSFACVRAPHTSKSEPSPPTPRRYGFPIPFYTPAPPRASER